jgi:hypothetical protein
VALVAANLRLLPPVGVLSELSFKPRRLQASLLFVTLKNTTGKDDSEVEGLVNRMGVMGIVGESGFVDGGGHEAGAAAGRPKVNLKLRGVEPAKGTLPAGFT